MSCLVDAVDNLKIANSPIDHLYNFHRFAIPLAPLKIFNIQALVVQKMITRRVIDAFSKSMTIAWHLRLLSLFRVLAHRSNIQSLKFARQEGQRNPSIRMLWRGPDAEFRATFY